MRTELLEMAAALARREESFVLAVVVARQPPSSAQVGDMALITASGDWHGWLGGSCTRQSAVREARRAIAEGTPRVLVLAPDGELEPRPGVTVEAMMCASGGRVEIYMEPVVPAARLVVFGTSPTARALAQVGAAAGYTVVHTEGGGDTPPAPGPPPTACHAIVATMGEGDEEAIVAALALRPAYLGVVASARRFAQIRETLLAQGVPAAALGTIQSPAGLAIGARGPAEIAISILAEIVQRQRAPTIESAVALVDPLSQAVDPICGMTVDPTTARHRAEHRGRTYYFCGGGCRARFVAEPERYA